MHKIHVTLGAALVLGAGAALFVVTPRSPAVTPAAAAQSKRVTVKIGVAGSQYAFLPAKKTITVGTKVVWQNTSDAPHTVTFTKAPAKFNKNIAMGAKLSFVFRKPGTYHYICTFHPYMKATIIVKG